MGDKETQDSPETKETVTDQKPVTDDALANAAAELTGKETVTEEPKETPKPKTTDEELEEHKERSNLGRKMKKIEDQMSEIQNILVNLNKPSQFQGKEEEMPEYISTVQDLERYEMIKDKKKQQQRQQYQNQYIQALTKAAANDGDEGESLAREILDMNSPFNRIVTGDPGIDARLNYAEASRAVYKKKTAQPKPPNVKGDKPPVSPQLNVTTRTGSTPSNEIELDDDAKDFIRITGMKDESVKAALGRK